MPQIGWFEIVIVVVLSILIIGPKDFPVMLKKIGQWIGSVKKYFVDIQKEVTDIEDTFNDELSLEQNKQRDIKNKDE